MEWQDFFSFSSCHTGDFEFMTWTHIMGCRGRTKWKRATRKKEKDRQRRKVNSFAKGTTLVIKFQAKSLVYYALSFTSSSSICMNLFCMSRHSAYTWDVAHNLPGKKAIFNNLLWCEKGLVMFFVYISLHSTFHCNFKPCVLRSFLLGFMYSSPAVHLLCKISSNGLRLLLLCIVFVRSQYSQTLHTVQTSNHALL